MVFYHFSKIWRSEQYARAKEKINGDVIARRTNFLILNCGTLCFISDNIYSFQISVRLYNSYNQQTGGNFDLCNGAIIHENYVVTTAHCVHSHIIEANIR